MEAYKGFNTDMTCRGFQYEEGKEYETDKAELCQKGFHACEDPLDCFGYYAPGESVFHRVEIDDNGHRNCDDSKVVGKRIKIGAKLSVGEICKLHFDFVKERTNSEHTDPDRATAGDHGAATAGNGGAATAGNRGAATAGDHGAATAGNGGAATAGYRGAATAGDHGAATAGNCGAATAGEYGAATAGEYGAATAGNGGAATAGYRGAATAGYRGAATAGECGAATSKGKSSVGVNGLAVARGNGCCVRGGLGSVLVLVEEQRLSYDVDKWKAVVVDGETIKADTWYKLENGEFVEVKDV